MFELPFSVSKADIPMSATLTGPLPSRSVTVTSTPSSKSKLAIPEHPTSSAGIPANFDVLLFGPAATVQLSANPGSITAVRSLVIEGVTASLSGLARVGNTAVMEEIPGQTAALSALARAGIVLAQRQPVVAGPVAGASSLARAGVVLPVRNKSLTGVSVAQTIDVFAGSVTAIRNRAVAGPTATVSKSAAPGDVTPIRNMSIAGPVAATQAAAIAGIFENIVNATVAGELSVINANAPAGTENTTSNVQIMGAVSNGDALSASGAISTVRNVGANGLVSGTSAVQAFNGLVTAIRNVAASGVLASAAAEAFAGVITAVVNYSVQRMNKVGDQSTTSSTQQVLGWESHAPAPATIVSDALDVQGGGASTVHATLWFTRNSTSGNVVMNLLVNGTIVDTFSITSTSTITGSGRPHYLMWNGTLAAGDDIAISIGRTISTTGTILGGSYVQVDPGNTTYQMRRMWKSTSQTPGTSRTQVSSMVADARYSSSTSSNSLVVDMAGTGTARAAVQITNTHATSTCTAYLVKNGTDIGSVTFQPSEDGTKWIEVPTTFVSGDLLRLDAIRDAAGGRTVGLGTTVEAKIPN
ncbi:minor tail protein [Gordonia phage Forza]|uniref:Minor tail protein n=1 Tax=Gordonia phage Forza TaxID=2571247 RepID=A0A650EYH5_9CAUD|nr:minor tail protein [Gordonia phage Forza]QEM41574.1 hypothetical protein SEA_BOOPY_107 [Gordonia phage Boopy]QGT55100.1 minor tail protein [Gordonia phage Forza]UXE04248.1 hypothetical protein SEA_BLUENGOLD_106 [Gordonia phage BlueNGold]WBF03888.1 hypothetical protein SEA_MAREELIH_105 [Gordonia phage Mareelih]